MIPTITRLSKCIPKRAASTTAAPTEPPALTALISSTGATTLTTLLSSYDYESAVNGAPKLVQKMVDILKATDPVNPIWNKPIIASIANISPSNSLIIIGDHPLTKAHSKRVLTILLEATKRSNYIFYDRASTIVSYALGVAFSVGLPILAATIGTMHDPNILQYAVCEPCITYANNIIEQATTAITTHTGINVNPTSIPNIKIGDCVAYPNVLAFSSLGIAATWLLIKWDTRHRRRATIRDTDEVIDYIATIKDA